MSVRSQETSKNISIRFAFCAVCTTGTLVLRNAFSRLESSQRLHRVPGAFISLVRFAPAAQTCAPNAINRAGTEFPSGAPKKRDRVVSIKCKSAPTGTLAPTGMDA